MGVGEARVSSFLFGAGVVTGGKGLTVGVRGPDPSDDVGSGYGVGMSYPSDRLSSFPRVGLRDYVQNPNLWGGLPLPSSDPC